MKAFLSLLMLAACADALITFKQSYLVDENDIKDNLNGVDINCSDNDGCHLYATKMTTTEVGLYSSGNVLIATLDTICKPNADGYITGYPLSSGGTYKLKKTGKDLNSAVRIYIKFDSAGLANVKEITGDLDINSNGGVQTVTLLNTLDSGMTFSNYKGKNPPQIYSAGFDVIKTCKAIYTATSVDNAAASKIGIISALVTVDFGSVDPSNSYHVAKFVSTTNGASKGQSFIAMSPGYTGCDVQHNYNDFALTSYDFKVGNSDETKVDVKFGDLSVSQGHELTLKITGQSDRKLSGTSPQSFSATASNLYVSISWSANVNKNDHFFAQIDFNGVSHIFGLSTVIAVFFALL